MFTLERVGRFGCCYSLGRDLCWVSGLVLLASALSPSVDEAAGLYGVRSVFVISLFLSPLHALLGFLLPADCKLDSPTLCFPFTFERGGNYILLNVPFSLRPPIVTRAAFRRGYWSSVTKLLFH